MWPRLIELLMGLWLCVSPFVFDASSSDSLLTANGLACGAIVVAASALSYWERTRHARVATALVGLWLLAFSYATAGRPADLELQNLFVTGLLLLLFVVVPNEANRPPRTWREFVLPPSDEAGAERPSSRLFA